MEVEALPATHIIQYATTSETLSIHNKTVSSDINVSNEKENIPETVA